MNTVSSLFDLYLLLTDILLIVYWIYYAWIHYWDIYPYLLCLNTILCLTFSVIYYSITCIYRWRIMNTVSALPRSRWIVTIYAWYDLCYVCAWQRMLHISLFDLDLSSVSITYAMYYLYTWYLSIWHTTYELDLWCMSCVISVDRYLLIVGLTETFVT